MTWPLRSLQIGLEWRTSGAGGADRVFAELIDHLPAEGVDCLGIVTGSAEAPSLVKQRVYSFAPTSAGTLERVRQSRAMIHHFLESSSIELVATHFALYAFGAIRQIAKYPHVVHFHGPWAAESLQEGKHRLLTSGMAQIERAVYCRADRVIVLSQAFAEVARQSYRIPAEKIRVVPGSVNISHFASAPERRFARASLGWPEDRTILISVRRLASRMGLDRLITAMRLVLQRFPETLLYIGGNGHMRGSLENQIRELGLQENVKLLGFIPDEELPHAYAAADLNIVPTIAWEGFGLVAAEALASGTPSLVTPVGGLRRS